MLNRKQKHVQPRARMPAAGSSRQAFSYNGTRSYGKEPELKGTVDSKQNKDTKDVRKVPKKTTRNAVLVVLLLVLIVVIAGLYSGSHPKIVVIEPNGYSYMPHSTSEYQKAATEAIDSSLYNHFKVTLSSSVIGNQLIKRFPEIAYAGVTLHLIGSTPTVYVQLTKPCLIYRVGGNSEYLVGDNGVIIGSSSLLNSEELASLPLVYAPYNRQLNSGDQVLSSANVTFIQTVKDALTAKKVAVSKMDLVPGAEELEVYIVGASYYVKFNLHETDALQQVGTYLATINTLKQQNNIPSRYIDVRVDGRAYYK